MDAVIAARKEILPLAAELGLAKFTLMPLILKATSLALAQHPILNSSISESAAEARPGPLLPPPFCSPNPLSATLQPTPLPAAPR